jgi:hypothetical protein
MGRFLVDRLRDDPRDPGPGDAPPATGTRWRGRTVEVRARPVPRHLWTTASIDVLLDGRCILRTGGEGTLTGSVSAEFDHGGAVHTVELSWGRVQPGGLTRRSFPYRLRIDGAELAASEVAVEHSWLVVIPYALVVSYLLLRHLALLR